MSFFLCLTTAKLTFLRALLALVVAPPPAPLLPAPIPPRSLPWSFVDTAVLIEEIELESAQKLKFEQELELEYG